MNQIRSKSEVAAACNMDRFCSNVKDAALAGLLKMQTKLEVDAAEVSGNPDLELEYVKEYQDMLQCVNEAAEKKVEASTVIHMTALIRQKRRSSKYTQLLW